MYRDMIREQLARSGFVGTNPDWVEAWMRLEHGTLDGLSQSQFKSEVGIAVQCIRAATTAENESLAQSFGCYCR